MGNLDEFIEYQIHLYVDRIVLPMLLVLGTVGNILILVVLAKPKHRNSPTALFLLALAVSDSLTLWFAVPHKWLISMFGIYIREFSEAVCRSHFFLTVISGQLSGFYIVVISLERFVYIMVPLRAKVICSLRNANIAIAAIPLGLVVISGHMFYGIGITEKGKCARNEEIYKETVWKLWQITNVTVGLFLPFIVMLVANTCIITKLALGKCTCKTNSLNKRSNTKGLALRKRTSQITVTLMLVIITFFICVIPIGVYYLLYDGEQFEYENTHQDAKILLFWSISGALFHTNNAINFMIYFLSGSKFRKEIKGLCCPRQSKAQSIGTLHVTIE